MEKKNHNKKLSRFAERRYGLAVIFNRPRGSGVEHRAPGKQREGFPGFANASEPVCGNPK